MSTEISLGKLILIIPPTGTSLASVAEKVNVVLEYVIKAEENT